MRAGAFRRGAQLLGTPLAAWLVATIVVCATAWIDGYRPFESATWIRWDSNFYLGIAHDGYTLFPCTWDHAKWCGNAGWFPGYPWLIAAVHRLGVPAAWAGVAIAWIFRLGTLVLMWGTFLERRRSAASIGVLLLAAFAPGGIYGFAVFPISLLTFATVACLWLLHRERWVAAGVAGAAGVLAYPLGLALVVVGAIWPFVDRSAEPTRRRAARAAVVAGIAVGGAVLVATVQRAQTGSWDAYRRVQDKYHHGFQVPLRPASHAVAELFDGGLTTLARAGPALQTLLVTVLLVAVVVTLVRRRALEQVDRLLLVWVAAAWFLATLQTSVSLYRSEATLLPAVLLARRLPSPFLFALVACAAALTVVMTLLFVDTTLF